MCTVSCVKSSLKHVSNIVTVQFLLCSVATTLPDERVRYWNGYMLFYEKMEEPAKTPVSAKKSKIQTRKAMLEGG